MPRPAPTRLHPGPLILLLLLALGATIQPGAAQPRPEPAPAPAATAEADEPLLWRIVTDTGTSWITGVLEYDLRLRDMPAPVRYAFDASDRLLVEVVPSETDSEVLLGNATMGEDESLRELLGPGVFETLVETVGASAEKLDAFEPWLAFGAALGTLHAEGPTLAFDAQTRAEMIGMPVTALETLAEQVELVEQIDRETYLAAIRSLLSDTDADEARVAVLADAWRAGDADGVMEHLEAGGFDAVIAPLAQRRVAAWLPALREAIDDGGAFIAVSAINLFGEQGLLARLEATGYTVDRAVPAGGSDIDGEAVGDGPFLWRVQSDAGTTWLFGTVHVYFRFADQPATVREAFAASSKLALEVDMDAVNPMLMVQRGALPPDRSLRQILGDETFDQLARQVTTVPAAALDRLKPWLAGMLLQQTLISGNGGLDNDLHVMAHERGIPLIGLETAEAQLDAIETGSEADQVASIRLTLSDLSGARRAAAILIDAYKEFDTGTIAWMTNQPTSDTNEAMLYQRNRNWIPKLRELIAEGGAFVAVGCAHLVGPGSVVELLRDAGYTVERACMIDGDARPDVPDGGDNDDGTDY